jgi:hypothetical protein
MPGLEINTLMTKPRNGIALTTWNYEAKLMSKRSFA